MPRKVKICTYRAYYVLIFLKMNSWIEADSVVNMVMYIPVAVATWASIPMRTRVGQKIIPGPTPQKAARKAPTQLTRTIFNMFLGVASRSPG